ncbi:hypothetical protein CY34DRAFT_711041 [Suillus luteus UH-Slu-Lm8-n1]|uniref:Uncharacterized protein n=1 Tax=Suillus luteus UH-Slu-Lm8-n1 TaxID=930992 RepID=A0A0D0B0D0_9AGAM|nr:hypothetical protein CY34DRAFT_711041 [Suillus luteus UH-Slu-Lm8-n1]
MLTSNFCNWTSQTSRHEPTHDLTASFFESGENRTAPEYSRLPVNGPANVLSRGGWVTLGHAIGWAPIIRIGTRI